MTVECRNCGRYADDMDGMCPHCGKSVFEQVRDVFYNGPAKPKKDLSVSSSGRFYDEEQLRGRFYTGEQLRQLATLDEPLSGARSRGRLPRKGTPLRPLNLPSPEDYGWLDNLTADVGRAQDLYEQCRSDWEKGVARAKLAQLSIGRHHQNERALRPDERHQYVTDQSDIAYEHAAWDAYELAREKYFRLLDELAETEKLATRPFHRAGGFEDPADPYRDPGRMTAPWRG